jgi:phage baseplate assembly protein W
MAQPTNYQLSIANALWVDVNTQYTVNALPDRVTDARAVITSSLFNLFNCMPGQRSRIFQPTYGSLWLQFLQEPLNDLTAQKMYIYMLKAIKQWEPRIVVDSTNTSIEPNTALPGYEVRIAFSMLGTSNSQQLQFQLPIN